MRPTLLNIPLELQEQILRHVYLLSRREPEYLAVVFQDAQGEERSVRTAVDVSPEDLEWESPTSNQCKSTLFPFNVASTCRLWRLILMRSSEYWTRILFDVAVDPTPLLGAFLWSKSQQISVYVFSSSRKQSTMEEQEKIALISANLTPHLSRCTSVAFETVYASSLPQPNLFFSREVPYLETLKLECAINDLTWNPKICRSVPNDTFPALRTISFTGATFMNLNPNWISTLKCGETVSLTICHLHLEGGHNKNSFQSFMELISKINFLRSLHLRSVSLSDMTQTPAKKYYLTNIESIHFDDVSENFIYHFRQAVSFSSLASVLRLSNCEISSEISDYFVQSLVLNNITAPTLSNIVSHWEGDTITIISCPGFNDNFLRSFSTLPIQLSHMTVEDCPNFTVAGMHQYLGDKEGKDDRGTKCSLRVVGQVPRLREEDLCWIQVMTSISSIEWAVENANGRVIGDNPLIM